MKKILFGTAFLGLIGTFLGLFHLNKNSFDYQIFSQEGDMYKYKEQLSPIIEGFKKNGDIMEFSRMFKNIPSHQKVKIEIQIEEFKEWEQEMEGKFYQTAPQDWLIKNGQSILDSVYDEKTKKIVMEFDHIFSDLKLNISEKQNKKSKGKYGIVGIKTFYNGKCLKMANGDCQSQQIPQIMENQIEKTQNYQETIQQKESIKFE